jgi:hypothetical protein
MWLGALETHPAHLETLAESKNPHLFRPCRVRVQVPEATVTEAWASASWHPDDCHMSWFVIVYWVYCLLSSLLSQLSCVSSLLYFIMICHDSVIQWRKHWETCQLFKCAQVQMRLKCNPNAVPLKLQSCDSSLVNLCRIWTLNCRRPVKSVQLWRDPGFPQRHVALSSNNFPYTYKMIKMRNGWVFIEYSSR